MAGAILDVVDPSSRAADAGLGVASALGPGTDLLVLDGCEARQAEVVNEVERLLAACPQVRIMTTSRERLGNPGRGRRPDRPAHRVGRNELLVDRARLLDPRFRLNPDELASADRLCTLVDRLPLGLELVARHLHLLRLDEVIQRVESDLGRWAGGPVGGRAGLWAALDASVDRLGPADRRALIALAVMVADADLGLIEGVADFGPDGADSFEIVARLVDASLVQVRAPRFNPLRAPPDPRRPYHRDGRSAELAAARGRYSEAVLRRAAGLVELLRIGAQRHAPPARPRDAPRPGDPGRPGDGLAGGPARRGSRPRDRRRPDRLLARRHPAEGMDWLGRLIEAADPDPALRAAALLARGHLAYWVTDFARGAVIVEEAQALFAALGDPLGEGRALRRRGAIAAATDDLPAAQAFLEASLARLDEAGEEQEIGTTLLHLGSLLADKGVVGEARPALERSLAIAVATGDPLANGHVLAALTLAHWKAGDLGAAMQTGNQALLIFRELGHRTTEGTVAYRLAAVARALDRPRAARRYAQLAIEAGAESSTRTTIALGHINLARVDLDTTDEPAAAGHLVQALERLDPEADRWVLVEALETVARLARRRRAARVERAARGGRRHSSRDPPAGATDGAGRPRRDDGRRHPPGRAGAGRQDRSGRRQGRPAELGPGLRPGCCLRPRAGPD